MTKVSANNSFSTCSASQCTHKTPKKAPENVACKRSVCSRIFILLTTAFTILRITAVVLESLLLVAGRSFWALPFLGIINYFCLTACCFVQYLAHAAMHYRSSCMLTFIVVFDCYNLAAFMIKFMHGNQFIVIKQFYWFQILIILSIFGCFLQSITTLIFQNLLRNEFMWYIYLKIGPEFTMVNGYKIYILCYCLRMIKIFLLVTVLPIHTLLFFSLKSVFYWISIGCSIMEIVQLFMWADSVSCTSFLVIYTQKCIQLKIRHERKTELWISVWLGIILIIFFIWGAIRLLDSRISYFWKIYMEKEARMFIFFVIISMCLVNTALIACGIASIKYLGLHIHEKAQTNNQRPTSRKRLLSL